MHKIPFEPRSFDAPTTVVLEASADVIFDLRLDTFGGEHFDRLEAVIALEVERDAVTLETVRTLEAWRRGESNAGRGRFTFPRSALEALWIAD